MAAVTREEVAAAALELVDREGLEAISMRRVGDVLGLSAMSLYHYFPSKDALLDGVFQAVLSELPPLRARGAWQGVVRARALQFRAVLARHPRAIALFATRPAVTVASIERVEELLEVLRGQGFSAREALRVFQCVLAYVVGHTMNSVADPATGPDYARLDPKRFRRVREVVALERYDLEDEFLAGLRAMLTGFS
jgi:AcrR family transcriptional regulator